MRPPQLPPNISQPLAPMHPVHREPHSLKDRMGRSQGCPKQSLAANTSPNLPRLRYCAVSLCQTQNPPTRSGTNLATRGSLSPVVSPDHTRSSRRPATALRAAPARATLPVRRAQDHNTANTSQRTVVVARSDAWSPKTIPRIDVRTAFASRRSASSTRSTSRRP